MSATARLKAKPGCRKVVCLAARRFTYSQEKCHAMLPSSHPDLQARYSNLLLVGPDSTVLAAAHQVGCHGCWQGGWARGVLRRAPVHQHCPVSAQKGCCTLHEYTSHTYHSHILPLCHSA